MTGHQGELFRGIKAGQPSDMLRDTVIGYTGIAWELIRISRFDCASPKLSFSLSLTRDE